MIVLLITGVALVVAGWLFCFFLDKPIVMRVGFLSCIGIGGFALFPIIAIIRDTSLPHETAHWHQQRRFVVFAGFIGAAIWLLLYFFVLPIIWNPFRRRWETDAYRVDGLSDEKIDSILRGSPYMLWL